jgi:starch-binding outer membrane protein, SusD/RagB family
MKKIFYIFSLVWLGTACQKSFVEDVVSPTNISPDGYYTSVPNFQAALTGIYGHLRTVYDGFFRMAEIPSDNSLSTATVAADTGPLDQMTWLNTTPSVLVQWQNAYASIAYCNNFIDQLQNFSDIDAALKARWLGEAKFIRALNYFNLVRFYGDVPLVLKKIETEQEAYSYGREPVAKVYEQIIKDLTEARENLPPQYTAPADLGRVTSGAARSMLGKVYLTLGRFSDAIGPLRDVVDGKRYILLPNFAEVFGTANENNREIIFSIQYAKGTLREGSNFCQNFLPSQSGADLLSNVQARGLNQGTRHLFDAFEKSDARKATALVQYTVGTNTTYYTRKFVDQPPAANEGENNWIVLRYADVALMYAEALNETGDTTNALVHFNAVRTRAGLAAKPAISQVNLRNLIDKERRIELCFEGHRWFDLVRRGADHMVSTMKAQFTADKVTYTVAPFRALFPIPFRETVLNPNLRQNEGY